jgi:hypothetical protein
MVMGGNGAAARSDSAYLVGMVIYEVIQKEIKGAQPSIHTGLYSF